MSAAVLPVLDEQTREDLQPPCDACDEQAEPRPASHVLQLVCAHHGPAQFLLCKEHAKAAEWLMRRWVARRLACWRGDVDWQVPPL